LRKPYVKAYRTPKLEIVVNQSIWMEGETNFADVILPTCTNFERWDVGEFANAGGYVRHSFNKVNNRVITKSPSTASNSCLVQIEKWQ